MMPVRGKMAVKPRSISMVDDIYGLSGSSAGGGSGGVEVGGDRGGSGSMAVESGLGLLRSTSIRTKSLTLSNRGLDELCTAIGGFALLEKLTLKENR